MFKASKTCLMCYKCIREDVFTASCCTCPNFNALGTLLGALSQKNIRQAAALSKQGESDFLALLQNLKKLYTSLPWQEFLMLLYLPAAPDGSRILTKFFIKHAEYRIRIPDLLTDCPLLFAEALLETLFTENWQVANTLIVIANDHLHKKTFKAQLPQVFTALRIVPNDHAKQQLFFQSLKKLPKVFDLPTFFKKLNQSNPIPEIQALQALAKSQQWTLLDEQLCFLTAGPHSCNEHLFNQMFISPDSDLIYPLLRNAELKQSALFSETIKNLLRYFITTFNKQTTVDLTLITQILKLDALDCLSQNILQTAIQSSFSYFQQTYQDKERSSSNLKRLHFLLQQHQLIDKFSLAPFFKILQAVYQPVALAAAHSCSSQPSLMRTHCTDCKKTLSRNPHMPGENSCNCPIFDNLGNFLGYLSPQHTLSNALLDTIGESSVENLLTQIQLQQQTTDLKDLRIILYLPVAPQTTLISKFFTTTPERLIQFIDIAPALLPNLLTDAILTSNWPMVEPLFKILGNRPELTAHLPLAFESLYIDVDDPKQQFHVLDDLRQHGLTQILYPQVHSFFPLLSIQGSITQASAMMHPLSKHPVEISLGELFVNKQWELLDRKLCFLAAMPEVFDNKLFDKLFLSPCRNQVYLCLGSPALQQQKLFNKTIQQLLSTFFSRLKENLELNNLVIDKIKILCRIGCVDLDAVQQAVRQLIAKAYPMDACTPNEAISAINVIYHACNEAELVVQFSLADFFTDMYEPYLPPSLKALPVILVSKAQPSPQHQPSAAAAVRIESLKKQEEIKKQKKAAEQALAEARKREERAQQALQKSEEEKRQKIEAARKELADSFREKQDFKKKVQIFNFLNATAQKKISDRNAQIENFQSKYHSQHTLSALQQTIHTWKAHTTTHRQVHHLAAQADAFYQAHSLNLHESLHIWRAVVASQVAEQKTYLQENIKNVFQLVEKIQPLLLITETLSYLKPLVRLAMQGKIELFVYGSVLSYCVYKLDELPSDIDIQIVLKQENIGLQQILKGLGFIWQRQADEYVHYQSSHLIRGRQIDLSVILTPEYRSLEPILLSRLKLHILPDYQVQLVFSNTEGSGYDPSRLQIVLTRAREGDFLIEFPRSDFQPTSFFSRVIKKFELWKKVFGNSYLQTCISGSIHQFSLEYYFGEAFCKFIPAEVQEDTFFFLSRKTQSLQSSTSLAELEILEILSNHRDCLHYGYIQNIVRAFVYALVRNVENLIQATQLLIKLFTQELWPATLENLRRAMDSVRQYISCQSLSHHNSVPCLQVILPRETTFG